MLQIELYLINKGPESVRKFIHPNLFQKIKIIMINYQFIEPKTM